MCVRVMHAHMHTVCTYVHTWHIVLLENFVSKYMHTCIVCLYVEIQVVTTLNILSTIANAMGSSSVKYVKTLMSGTIGVLSDGKVCTSFSYIQIFRYTHMYVCMYMYGLVIPFSSTGSMHDVD